jgi:hypothetical protein
MGPKEGTPGSARAAWRFFLRKPTLRVSFRVCIVYTVVVAYTMEAAVSRTPEPEKKTIPVRLDLTPEQHRDLRVVAAQDGVSMAEFARRAVVETVERGKKKTQNSV